MPDARKTPSEAALADVLAELHAHGAFFESLCARAELARWGCSAQRFAWHLARCAASRFKNQKPLWEEAEGYFAALHLEDFALACACGDGADAAWDFFVLEYRGYLRKCAGAMLRRNAESPEARELADSLFAELYGLADGRRGARSLFRYFHGRSSLKTWLRAVLAQRHVDGIRAARRFASLDEDALSGQPLNDSRGAALPRAAAPALERVALPADPYREKYLALFGMALRGALERLAPLDRRRVGLYYVEDKTLAEIGRLCGEHESSVSRNLERIRRELRALVEEDLRRNARGERAAGEDGVFRPGLSDAQIALCFQYATEDAPIDFDSLFPRDGRGAAEETSPETWSRKNPRRNAGSQES
ncbi:MAG: sigma-70 family RNA polymerase sigma factor [Candidatus Acidiferrum sp.]|jgi:RNA polymerase sigma factor (sigma-70 family)